jgi:hypothetical protein
MRPRIDDVVVQSTEYHLARHIYRDVEPPAFDLGEGAPTS